MKRSRLLNIFLVVFIDLLGFGLILPLLPYFAGQYGASQFLIGLLVASYAAALFQSMFTLWAKDRLNLNAQTTSYLLAYVGQLSVIVQGGLIGQLTKRFSEAKLIAWGVVIQGQPLAWAFTPGVPVLMVVLIPLAFSTGVLNTVINSAITRSVPPQEVGGAGDCRST